MPSRSTVTRSTDRDLAGRRRRAELAKHACVLGLLILTFYPFVFMVQTSFKNNSQLMNEFWSPALPLHLDNYARAAVAIAPYVLNSVIVSGTTVVGVLVLSSLSAYVFARFTFPGSTLLFLAVISLLMVPGSLTLVPAFVWIKNLNLLNSRWALILPYLTLGQITAIFILRGFFASLPEEIFEAARIDGASEWRIYLRIILPLSRPILGTVAVLNLVGTWNDYIWPLVVISDNALRTIPIGLAYFTGEFNRDWGALMAGYTLASIPLIVVFVFAMRPFLEGLTSGAIKM